ncbi:SDR family NAD(P)-dependent oxidoreductase [Paenibacillus thalictri]|uniref:3-oxoacyl-ACP reductase FabG n=1 Tax=Paenibacillus thalictri TaxID=2527873 RepID=A0A4Q9DKA5_9BACL|nr:3-oxoacyl-ACP reductase family protein [Paenibacillus thalictri]TBL75174.1 3-oxoacyl-ACP reductase FabG [Paenibacillus thalictri]
MNIDLTGQIALVTGASGGIGQAIAIDLAACGADIAVNYLSNRDGAEQTAAKIRELGRKAVIIQADVTKEDEIASLVKQTEEALGGTVDILINNAGHLVERRTIETMTLDLYSKVMNVNLLSTVFVSKAVIPGMKAKKSGVIINMSSLAAHNGGANGASVYAASKGAVLSLSKGLAKELAPHGIRVNVVSPGFIEETKFHSTFTSEEGRIASIKSVPLGRGGVPQDVSGAVVYLVSPLAAYLTGESIEINGGMFMR